MIDLTDIAPSFSFVIDKGLVSIASDHREHEFGNATLVAVGPSISLRFERDRGQLFIDAGSSATGWYKLEYVLEFVDNDITQEQLGEPPDPSAMAILLQSNWTKVANLFGDQNETSRLQIFATKKSAALIEKLFRKA